MRQLMALIRHEITEGRMVLLTAFVASWLPLLAPFLPGVGHHRPQDVRFAVLAVLLFLLGTILVIGVGFSFIGRDLAERRFGFYLVQPIPGWTLWLGKLLGAYALVVSALVLILLPTVMVSWNIGAPGPPRQIALGLVAVLLLLMLSHAASIMARDRSVWLLIDLIALTVVAAAGWTAVDRLLAEQAELSFYTTLLVAGVTLLLALFAAGGAQVALGRSDLGRGHRFLSLTLWPASILIALGFVAYVQWLVTPSLADLERLRFVVPAARGTWLAVGGTVKHGGYHAVFLLDSATGKSHHVGSLAASGKSLVFAADGGTAVWARCRRLWDEPCDLWWQDLDAGSEARRLNLELDSPRAPLALSADGSRLAVYQYGSLGVFGLPEGRLLAAVKTDRPEKLSFATRDHLRLLAFNKQDDDWFREWSTFEIASGQLVRDEGRRDSSLMRFDSVLAELAGLPDRQQRLYEHWMRGGLPSIFMERLYVMTSGELVTIEEWHRDQPKIFVLSAEDEKRELALPHETERWSLLLGGEAEPGKLTIGWLRPQTATGGLGTGVWSTYLLDIESGELRCLADHAVPLRSAVTQPAGTLAMRIMVSADALLLWDPERQDTRSILTFKAPQPNFRELALSTFNQDLKVFYP